MATVNFSVPERTKRAFNEAFKGENKSAVVARLMDQAIEERRRAERRAAAVNQLLELRRTQRPASDAEIARARHHGRP